MVANRNLNTIDHFDGIPIDAFHVVFSHDKASVQLDKIIVAVQYFGHFCQ